MREMHARQLQIAACQESLSSHNQGASAREAEAAVLTFLQWLASGVAGGDEEVVKRKVASMEAVVVSVLTGLCKQLLQIESTASRTLPL